MSLVLPTWKKTKAVDVQEKEANELIRQKFKVRYTKKGTTYGSQFDAYFELLKLSFTSPEVPMKRARVFILGEENSLKERFLGSLFNVPEEHLRASPDHMVLGDYDSKTFRKLGRREKTDFTVMNVWNYGWERVFKYFKYLFFVRHSFLIFVFNMKAVLDEDIETISRLKGALFAKKLLAPSSPAFLVGEGAKDIDKKGRKKINQILQTEVFQTNAFSVVPFDLLYSYAPVDSETGENLNKVRERVFAILNRPAGARPNMFHEPMPKTINEAYEKLKFHKKEYFTYKQAKSILSPIGIRDDDLCELLLKVMTKLGYILFTDRNEKLKKIVIIQPELVMRAASVPVYKHDYHPPLNIDIDDAGVVNDFQLFCNQRILSVNLLLHTWERMNIPEETHEYLVALMKANLLLGEYSFDNNQNFLTPTFFDNIRGNDGNNLNEEDYQGPYFVLDFSGNHSRHIARAGGEYHARYMPFSFFEKLVSLCIQVSATYGQAIRPISLFRKARLSFGVELKFIISVMSIEGEEAPFKIKIASENGTSQEDANVLVERIFSMSQDIKESFYTVNNEIAELVVRLLVPDNTGELESLADYEDIQEATEEGSEFVWANVTQAIRRNTEDYSMWREGSEFLKVGKGEEYVPHRLERRITIDEFEHHVFLSYNRNSALDLVTVQLRNLKNLGFSCWVDTEFKGSLNESVYLENLKKSMCFMLLLSENVFSKEVIVKELKCAVENEIPIIFLHHPDTNKMGYWTFNEYITSCPFELRYIFDEVKSIGLESRYYLQEAVTNKIVAQLRELHAARS